MKTALLTCTGGRPETFALAEIWISKQTVEPDFWVVVDDVNPPTELNMDQILVRPEPLWKRGGGHTLSRNLIAGLEKIKELSADLVMVIEDDDWYAPNYIESMREWFWHGIPRRLIVGERDTIYYHVGCRQYRQNWHPGHASLCSVSFHVDIIDKIISIAGSCRNTGIDFAIFRNPWPENSVKLLGSNLCVGIKGAPASRLGIGSGHRRIPHSGIPDPDLSFLRELIGSDAEYYVPFFNPENFQSPIRAENSSRQQRRPRRRVLQGKALEISEATKRRRR